MYLSPKLVSAPVSVCPEVGGLGHMLHLFQYCEDHPCCPPRSPTRVKNISFSSHSHQRFFPNNCSVLSEISHCSFYLYFPDTSHLYFFLSVCIIEETSILAIFKNGRGLLELKRTTLCILNKHSVTDHHTQQLLNSSLITESRYVVEAAFTFTILLL